MHVPGLRPLAWLAGSAFTLGFVGYLALAQPHSGAVEATDAPATAMVSGPVSDAWNFEKKI